MMVTENKELIDLMNELKEMKQESMRKKLDEYRPNLYDDLCNAFGEEMTSDIFEVIEYGQSYRQKYGADPYKMIEGILNEMKAESSALNLD